MKLGSLSDTFVTPTIEVRGVSKAFGGVTAVDDVSISFPPKKVSSLIGPNGAGKTTLFNIICRGLSPDHGEVLHKGDTITRLDASELVRRRIARTFQHPLLIEDANVTQNVRFAAEAHHSRSLRRGQASDVENRIRRAIEIVGLDDAKGNVGILTTLDRQRTAIAMALSTDPEVILLDEPTGGLVAAELAEIRRVIMRLRDDGLSVILIEHKMELVMAVSDQVSVLEEGRLLVTGDPASVRANSEVIRAYLGDVDVA